MANGNTTASRLGQVNVAGDVDALFLKVFSGEILTTFEEFNVMKGLHTMRTIANGKSAQFPVTGIATAKYHTPGENIADGANSYLSSIKHAERTINIDDVLIASTFIANIDELKNHYDIRSIYAQELGKALAKRFDLATMKTLAAAARSAATITGGKAGITINRGSGTLTGAGIQASLFSAAQKLDENDIPDDGARFAILKPADYYTLIASGEEVVNRDFGGRGDVVGRGVVGVAKWEGVCQYVVGGRRGIDSVCGGGSGGGGGGGGGGGLQI